jgi:hypothetical protein
VTVDCILGGYEIFRNSFPTPLENIGEKLLSERSEQILRKENLTKLDIFIECIRAVECLLTRKRLVIVSLKLSTGV